MWCIFILQEVQLYSMADLLIEIGLGNRLATLVAKRLVDMVQQSHEAGDGKLKSAAEVPLIIKGTEGMVVSFAECCCPIPGDPIVGVLTSGQGIIVHVEQCSHLDKLRRHHGAFMPLRWDKESPTTFPVIIRVEAIDQPRLLAKMAAAISDADANIEDVHTQNQGGQYFRFIFKLSVRDRMHVARILRKLRNIPVITRITRGFG